MKSVVLLAILAVLLGCENKSTEFKKDIVYREISLAAYRPSSHPTGAGACGMVKGVMSGSKLYVACQRLVGWMPTDTSLIVVINTANDSIEGTIPLTLRNPQDMILAGGKLYLACTGAYGALDGGVEAVNLATQASEGSVINEADVNGDISRLAVVNDTLAYVAVTLADYSCEIRPFNPGAKTVAVKLGFIADVSAGPLYDGRYVYAGEKGGSVSGIIVIDPMTGALVRGPVATGLDPYSLASIGASNPQILIIGSNYSEGNLSSLHPDSASARSDLMVLSGDAVACAYGNDLYVLDRYNATISRIAAPFNSTSVDFQLSVGVGSNPYDIAFASATKAYVIRYNTNTIWVVNPSTGTRIVE
jgi:hypothetical protein